MKRIYHIAIAQALAILLLAACGTRPSPSAAFSQEPTAVTIEVLVAESYSGITDSRRLVIRDAATWQAVWKEIVGARTPAPQPPGVDFDQNMVILAAMGQRGTGGYAIRIDEVAVEDGQLNVVVRETAPGPGCMTIQALTAPVTAVRVTRSEEPVSFIERAETFDCQ